MMMMMIITCAEQTNKRKEEGEEFVFGVWYDFEGNVSLLRAFSSSCVVSFFAPPQGVVFRVLKRLEKEGERITQRARRIRDLGEDSGERTHNDDGRLVLLRRATRKFFTPAQKRVAGRNTIEEKWYAM